jgi:hypothetical protein
VFHDDADTGDTRIEECGPDAHLVTSGLFWGCGVRTPAGS